MDIEPLDVILPVEPLADTAEVDISSPNEVDDVLQDSEPHDIELSAVGGYLYKCAVNLVLPFINGMMIGFGEIFAHELLHSRGWTQARIYRPLQKIPAFTNGSKEKQLNFSSRSVLT
ncbi:Mim1 protein [Martiniozyma asiatica (nom. inval.)]|nr:Mim1 protein [Martiniozyma asiatica]